MIVSVSKADINCGCNRLYREHSWDVIDGVEQQWNQRKHTRSAYNNAYGFIPNSRTPYIRCDIETNPNILAKLIFDVWKVKFPRLIMCIIGGAKYFKLNERLEKEFIKGIIQAALKAGKRKKSRKTMNGSHAFCFFFFKRWLDCDIRIQNRRCTISR